VDGGARFILGAADVTRKPPEEHAFVFLLQIIHGVSSIAILPLLPRQTGEGPMAQIDIIRAFIEMCELLATDKA
jgi:hypothetical protein